MVDRRREAEAGWTGVDDYIADRLLGADPVLSAALAAKAAAGLPDIDLSLVVDNVVREGGVLEADSTDPRVQGTRALFDAVAAEPRLSATAVQTVGAKKWDGFLLAVVGE